MVTNVTSKVDGLASPDNGRDENKNWIILFISLISNSMSSRTSYTRDFPTFYG